MCQSQSDMIILKNEKLFCLFVFIKYQISHKYTNIVPTIMKSTDFYSLFDFFSQNKLQNKHFLSQYIRQAPIIESLNNLHYPSCQKQDHQSQPLSMICIDKQCNNKTLICSMCENQSHYKHITVPLKVYLNNVYGHLYATQKDYAIDDKNKMKMSQQNNNANSQPVLQKYTKKMKNKNKNKSHKSKNLVDLAAALLIKKQLNKQSSAPAINENILYYTSKIDQSKKNYISNIQRLKQNMLQKFHILQTMATKYFNKANQEAIMLLQMQNPLQFIEKSMNKCQQYTDNKFKTQSQQQKNKYVQSQKDEINKLRNYVSNILKITNIQEKFVLQTKMEQIMNNCKELSSKCTKTINKADIQYMKVIDKQILQLQKHLQQNILSSYSIKPKIQFAFSQKLKGHKMSLRNNNFVCQQTGMQASGQRFALIQPALLKPKDIRYQPQKWGIKVTKIIGWIGIGIALKKPIVKANFGFQYTNIGHGSYLLSANGYTWSHSIKQSNSAYKSFTYTVGDIIYIQYNAQTKKLKFVKNKNEKQYTLDVVDAPEDDQYYPCVNICSNGDTVQVINDVIQFV